MMNVIMSDCSAACIRLGSIGHCLGSEGPDIGTIGSRSWRLASWIV